MAAQFQPSEELRNRLKIFGATLTPEQKDELADLLADVAVEYGQEFVRQRLEEGRKVMGINLLTLLR